jgi:beta-glucosidase-like glycosyl hydrolase
MRPLLLLTTLAAAKDLQKLIKQMTLEEKLGLLHGSASNYTGATTAITRLGVPRLLLNDGPQGFRTPDYLEGTSTAFPSGLAVAATFDDALAATWASTIASEFAKKGATVLLGPGLNVARVPFNGRNFEYCSGEDPYLGARMASAIIPAIQSQDVIATAKHYVLNNQETGRIGADSIIDERTWRELYLPPFESAVAHGALSAMCSYNRVTLNNVTAWACGHRCGNQPATSRRWRGGTLSLHCRTTRVPVPARALRRRRRADAIDAPLHRVDGTQASTPRRSSTSRNKHPHSS